MTNDQQEAVCGTCGGFENMVIHDPLWAEGRAPGHSGHRFTPAPVVPSDNERCAVCGDVLRRGECQTCLAVGAIPLDAAPPTPSQDAEGDGLAEAWRAIERVQGIGVGVLHRDRVERAIRAPYEELVTAARDAAAELERVPTHGPGNPWSEKVLAALTRVEESLGGRK